ncbi:MAG TPA: DUF4230 domain-containing protein [Chthoniobacterales bacterium]|jgi:hypothetical protein
MEPAHPVPPAHRFGWPLAAAVSVFILALLCAFLFYRCETFPAHSARGLEKIGREAGDAFARLAHLRPQVTVNNRVYLEQTASVAQLAVVDRQVEVEHEMTHSWAGSTKRIKLHGTFSVKAGFDLRKKFSVRVAPDEVVIEMPHAEILSVEQEKVDVLVFENGFWNRISPHDIEHELAALPQLARAQSSGLPAEAENVFTRELLQQFHPAQRVRTIFPAPTPGG